MKYRDRTTGQIYGLFDLQQKFSHVSFPNTWDSSTYDYANVDPVVTVDMPPVTSPTNRVDYVGVQFVNGQWTDVWTEVPRFDDPTEQAAWEAECIQIQWDTVRGRRDLLLANSDYTMMPDTPITSTSKAKFVAYRQTLRDITTQSDPFNIIWPIVPVYERE